jgi:hypothetical protein
VDWAAEGIAGVNEVEIDDHKSSERRDPRSAVTGRRALVGPKTRGLLRV